jgi:hypothetical protein
MLNSLSTTKSLIKNIKTASATSSGTNTYGSNLVGSLNSNNATGYGLCTLGTTIGTNQFTIEFWYYPINGTFGGIAGLGPNGSTGNWSVMWSFPPASGNRFVNFQDRTVGVNTYSSALPLNTWSHVAITRNSANLIQIYVNGVQGGTTNTYNYNYSSSAFALFSPYADIQQTANGYITAFKITKSCVYTANFTPTNKQIVSDANTVLLLNVPSSSTYTTDSSSYGRNLTSYSLVYTTLHP